MHFFGSILETIGAARRRLRDSLIHAAQRVEIKITHCRTVRASYDAFWLEMRKISPVDSSPPCSGAHLMVQ